MTIIAARSVTLNDVATEAGVSLATASRSLNGSVRRVNPELQTRVRDAARKLGYVVDAQAQAVARGTSSTVALVIGDIADPYFSGLAAGLIRAARLHDLTVTMAMTGSDPEAELSTVEALQSQRPRAIILAGSRHTGAEHEAELDRMLTAFEQRGGRVAVVASSADDSRADRVVQVNNRLGASQLGRTLGESGYSDFVVLAGSERLVTPVARVAGFLEGVAAAGVRIGAEQVLAGEFSRDGGYEATQRLLDSGRRPECIFAVTDVMAVGAMAALRDNGLNPGSDVAVAGFDDIAMLADVHPRLTTVALPLAEIGERALNLVLADATSGGGYGGAIEGVVRLRESTPRAL